MADAFRTSDFHLNISQVWQVNKSNSNSTNDYNVEVSSNADANFHYFSAILELIEPIWV